MPRVGLFKRAALFATAICLIASVINARELECIYDYTTHKEVRRISETQDASEELKYTFGHEYSKFGKELWPFESEPSLEQTPGQQNYIRVSNNLYHWGRGIFKHLIFIDFEKPTFYEIISFGPALYGLEKTSRKLNGNDRMLEVPVTVWDCKRLD